MKSKLLITTLLLLLCAPVYAVERSLSIEYSYTAPTEKTVTGFVLYQNGVQVCTTNVIDVKEFTCSFDTVPGLYDYSMEASYLDGSTSHKSPTYSFTILESTGSGVLVPVLIKLIVNELD